MKTSTTLSPVAMKFVLKWGEMGTKWGVNRTVAQIHALLYISERPLTAAEIGETLSVAQSNVSTSLRELQGWKLIKIVHVLGDRRDHFESMKDVWEMFKVVLDERKKREVDPTLAMLNECVAELDSTGKDVYIAQRLISMREFFEDASGWYDEIKPIPVRVLRKLMRLGGKVTKLLAGFSAN
jgi:DNA-binding transcriptional regulator GbsR (MarR family)